MMRRVVKLGGSLLACDDGMSRLNAWLARQPAGEALVVVGGGEPVEKLRRLHAAGELDDEAAHWQAIDAMAENSRRIALAWRMSLTSMRLASLKTQPPQARALLPDAAHFMRNEDPHLAGGPLRASWDVTSDSIAARMALAGGADELVLLKSRLPASSKSVQELADADYVDRAFPTAAAGVRRIRLVNLRSDDFDEAAAAIPGIQSQRL